MNNRIPSAVIFEGVNKRFRIPLDKSSGIKQVIVNIFKRKKGYREFNALENVSFNVKKGEFFGIVGRNGSGKSTLLKILAGVYSPDFGGVAINGSLTPFIELGVGFNPELSGRENVFLNGALLGFSHQEMGAMYSGIVEFAELEAFMGERLKNYSSGMQVRLAFSIAIRAKSDILVLDEVLAVGDSEFQNKCYTEFRKLKLEGRTIVFVTHDMSAVERFCDRVLVLQKGKVHGIYSPAKASTIYQRMNIKEQDAQETIAKDSKRWGNKDVTVDKIEIFDKSEGADSTTVITQGGEVTIKIHLKGPKDVRDITVGLAFHDKFGLNLSGPNSEGVELNSNSTVTFRIPKLPLAPGEYVLTVVIFNKDSSTEYDHIEEAAKFTVIRTGHLEYGKVSLFGKWS